MDSSEDDFQVDLRDLISQSPIKKTTTREPPPAVSGVHLRVPDLGPPSRVGLSEELFQVTRNLRKMDRILSTPVTYRRTPRPTRLNNDKVNRFISTLRQSNPDFALDDQLRGRYYGRNGDTMPPPPGQSTANMSSSLDSQLESFLDKENIFPEPTKKLSKKQNQQSSSNALILGRVDLNSGKRKRGSRTMSLSPPLQRSPTPYSDQEDAIEFAQRSPKRRCVPQHRFVRPQRSSLVSGRRHGIYIVDSSTGSLDEATSYATELNSSAPGEFQYPDNPNEIVHIPTESLPKKMAIIRMVETKSNPSEATTRVKKKVQWKEDLKD
ncbi:hypothetical protein DIURU_004558 [Diutina rugosa]|uniref:Uncharacterized protein n=1 Tax=Diutina rugosa TaxID=5481 RepID=A0A642UGW5_DIURU|nr:uncharacterized protein DIURU_004558 [Diutina rugosa]KAA8898714.1 hypothetical protein DIURU_004558 [Diutina rugosa]